MREVIRRRALELGFDDCRITSAATPESASRFEQWLAAGEHGEMDYLRRTAPKRVNPQAVLPGAKSIISLAVSYWNPLETEEPVSNGPAKNSENPQAEPPTCRPSVAQPHMRGLIARYARYRDYHFVLEQPLKSLVDFVQSLGDADTRCQSYVDTGPVLERDLAQRAGLGFMGKHTNLISRRLGNWLFLCEILTTLELEPDSAEVNRCGSCARCIDACPTGAIRAPFQLDARRCISYLTIELKGSIPVELREAIGDRVFGCDDCLAVCPWNRFAREGALMRTHARPNLAALELLELLSLDEAGFRAQFAGTPIARCKRRGLLRNVCVALGNVGDSTTLAKLGQAAVTAEPLIAEHAQWAIKTIERRIKSPPLPPRANADADE